MKSLWKTTALGLALASLALGRSGHCEKWVEMAPDSALFVDVDSCRLNASDNLVYHVAAILDGKVQSISTIERTPAGMFRVVKAEKDGVVYKQNGNWKQAESNSSIDKQLEKILEPYWSAPRK